MRKLIEYLAINFDFTHKPFFYLLKTLNIP